MPELRTYKGKHTIAEWWVLAEDAHKKRNKRRLFQQFIRPRDLVFDIGAERGMLTMVFRWMDARVIAVEPEGCPALCESFRQGKPASVECHTRSESAASSMPFTSRARRSRASRLGSATRLAGKTTL